MKKNLLPCALAILLVATGCATADMVPTWAITGLDTRTQPEGKVLVLDSPRNWRILSEALDAEVKREYEGRQPPGSIDTWTEFWRTTFTRMNTGQEHPERYFAFVVQLRRHLELPDLPKFQLES